MDPNQMTPAQPVPSQTLSPVAQPQQTPPPQPTAGPPKQSSFFARLFTGRMNRKDFWFGFFKLAAALIVLMLTYTLSLFAFPRPAQTDITHVVTNPISNIINVSFISLAIIYNIVFIPYIVSLYIRRLHDLNRSGWVMVLTLIPLVQTLLFIYVGFFPGTNGDNRYGPKA